MTHMQNLTVGLMQGLGVAFAPLVAFGIYVCVSRRLRAAEMHYPLHEDPALVESEERQPTGFHRPRGA